MRVARQKLAATIIGLLATCSGVVAQPYSPVPLPPESDRVVIGTWRLVEPDIKCTRSIEQVAERFYMVARCVDIAGVNGTRGLPLTRTTERVYRNQAGSTYEIQEDGMLFMIAGGHIDMRGRPQKELWPK
jgi:hypothetical protein